MQESPRSPLSFEGSHAVLPTAILNLVSSSWSPVDPGRNLMLNHKAPINCETQTVHRNCVFLIYQIITLEISRDLQLAIWKWYIYQNRHKITAKLARSFTHPVHKPIAVCNALPLTHNCGLMGVPYEKLTRRVALVYRWACIIHT